MACSSPAWCTHGHTLKRNLAHGLSQVKNLNEMKNLKVYDPDQEKSFTKAYFMNHTFSFVIQHPLFNLHTS